MIVPPAADKLDVCMRAAAGAPDNGTISIKV